MLTFLLIFTAYVAFKIAWKIGMQYRCLEDELISDYFNGRLRGQTKRSDQVIAHLGICEKCRQKLVALSEEDNAGLEDHLIDRN